MPKTNFWDIISAIVKIKKPVSKEPDWAPKFDNGDISLEEAVRLNGNKLEHVTTGLLEDTSWY